MNDPLGLEDFFCSDLLSFPELFVSNGCCVPCCDSDSETLKSARFSSCWAFAILASDRHAESPPRRSQLFQLELVPGLRYASTSILNRLADQFCDTFSLARSAFGRAPGRASQALCGRARSWSVGKPTTFRSGRDSVRRAGVRLFVPEFIETPKRFEPVSRTVTQIKAACSSRPLRLLPVPTRTDTHYFLSKVSRGSASALCRVRMR